MWKYTKQRLYINNILKWKTALEKKIFQLAFKLANSVRAFNLRWQSAP